MAPIVFSGFNEDRVFGSRQTRTFQLSKLVQALTHSIVPTINNNATNLQGVTAGSAKDGHMGAHFTNLKRSSDNSDHSCLKRSFWLFLGRLMIIYDAQCVGRLPPCPRLRRPAGRRRCAPASQGGGCRLVRARCGVLRGEDYLFPLARLWVTHSISQLLRSLVPPLDHAVTWSASISSRA